jgi:hypothetical protein
VETVNTSAKIDIFKYEWEFLSNFYPCEIVWEGITYASTEHAYQAAKTLDIEKRRMFGLEDNPRLTAKKAKDMGANIKKNGELRSDWLKVNIGIMRELLVLKFEKEELKQKLLSTGTAYLEEGNWWEDNFWGVCYGGTEKGFHGIKCGKWPHVPSGENHLGLLLMAIRATFIPRIQVA